ncbi:hypothetical protein VTK26DRAFT_2108 [Humicola hyalothermophila]
MPICHGRLSNSIYESSHRCYNRPLGYPTYTSALIDQVLSALAFIQAQRIVHRDIKPDNILYTSDPTAHDPWRNVTFYLSDLGTAVPPGSEVARCVASGTPGYMAPEVSQQGVPSKSMDLYSFGVILLEVVGYWRYHERLSDFAWMDKLKGYKEDRWWEYEDWKPRYKPVFDDELCRHSRIEMLLEWNIIPGAFRSVLSYNPKDRKTAKEARTLLLNEYPPLYN